MRDLEFDFEEEARQEVKDLDEHLRVTVEHNVPAGFHLDPTQVWHRITYGAHIDPDLGVEYVPLNEPVIPYRQRKIGHRNAKVRRLEEWIVREVTGGTPAETVARELKERQSFEAIVLCRAGAELEQVLHRAFANDWIYPRCLEGGHHDLIGMNGLLFGWYEGVSCEGGVTDRYYPNYV